MKEDENKILITYREGEKNYCISVSRKEFYDHMAYLKGAFPSDMTIITEKLLEFIPNMTRLKINEDFNITQDIPFVLIEENNSKNFVMLKIPRCNSIIWGFLYRYCYDAKIN